MNQNYYVYYLIDPRNCQPFYIGKGKGNRMFVHEQEVVGNHKTAIKPHHDRIREILAIGLQIQYEKVLFNATETQALNKERILIEQYGRICNGTGILLNKSSGGSNGGTTEKTVCQYTMEGEFIQQFSSAKVAAEQISSANRSYIAQCCKGKRKSSGGFQWTYKSELPPNQYHKQYERPVLQFTLDGEFVAKHLSVSKAAKSVGKSLRTISCVCRGKSKQSGGFIWKYEDTEPLL